MEHDLTALRHTIAAQHTLTEDDALSALFDRARPSALTLARASTGGADLVRHIRSSAVPGLMESFLAEYGLSTREGIALMCLAEALLRVPDAATIDALIEDKIAPSAWGAHLGSSSSVLVNASTWGLMLTGKVLQDEGEGLAASLRGALRRLGEPVIRAAVGRAMKEMGRQFVLGESIASATARAAGMKAKGYTYSYDMLGEAALTARDADAFFKAYEDAIAALAPLCTSDDIRENPGISIKLSALHPRYEELQRHRLGELTERCVALARAAAAANMGLNIDAEEAERLEPSLDVMEAVTADAGLNGWDGFGVVVQGYSKRAPGVIDWLAELAKTRNARFMTRLVKGAYWDREIKRAQVEGLQSFPVYTRKTATDAAYLCCANLLLKENDRIYAQFATHNAHSGAAILEMAEGKRFEFQRLHGMGEALHEALRERYGTACRIYAPVGAHRDLLAYLVRRLLENGANSSFVHQLLDEDVPPEEIATCPFEALGKAGKNAAVTAPDRLFAQRVNSRGWDLWDRAALAGTEAARDAHTAASWTAGAGFSGATLDIRNPAVASDSPGIVTEASAEDIARAITAATPAPIAPQVLRSAADLYEQHHGELFALLTREAGKTLTDAVAELREAVDFLRYYADQTPDAPARGIITCISPWNFPLAIFTGQIAAALTAGNAVLAKPAEATPLVAARAVALMHEAGVPQSTLQLLPGRGSVVGAALTSDPRIGGVTFTGSTATAQVIHRNMADHLAPDAMLIAETGGLNAMIVDSTALPEQAVRDIILSAFRSAGQRCSALRVLYLQEDIAEPFLEMLKGAMDELITGDPARRETDIGPVISAEARAGIAAHIEAARADGRVLKELARPTEGHFVAPTLISLPGGIRDLAEEIFGPVLHVATFKAEALEAVVDGINAKGFGLTFGMHSRIDDRVEAVSNRIRAGNVYVNRNQIGAIVGSQPFGGEGLSGTGPKAGGPHYVPSFTKATPGTAEVAVSGTAADAATVARDLAALPDLKDVLLGQSDLPGPTGESNLLTTHPRGRVLCLGPGPEAAEAQARLAEAAGNAALAVPQSLAPGALATLGPLDAVLWWGDAETARAMRQALAQRDSAIVPLITDAAPGSKLILERHLCIDTTAAGGNATLLAAAG